MKERTEGNVDQMKNWMSVSFKPFSSTSHGVWSGTRSGSNGACMLWRSMPGAYDDIPRAGKGIRAADIFPF